MAAIIESGLQSQAPGEDSPGTGASCCSEFYELDWVREILEDNFHPGGQALTRRCMAAMDLSRNALVADLGCGTGSSALLLAQEYPYRVCGVDKGAANIVRAEERQRKAGIAGRQLRFLHGDAAALPFCDGELDAILAECSFSLIADQETALAEFHRVLRSGGMFAISDMAVEGSLPADIAEVIAPWTCLVQAHGRAGFEAMFEHNGFEVLDCTDESAGLSMMIAQIKRKLVLLGTGLALGKVQGFDIDLASARHWLQRMQAEVDIGRIRYLSFRLRRTEKPA
jgi:arsenite methyltransferase